MLNGTPTPRKRFFTLPPELDESQHLLGDGKDSDVPPTPATIAFLERREYQDQGVIGKGTIIAAFCVALLLLLLVVLFGRDSLTLESPNTGYAHHHAATSPSVKTAFPDFHEQCHQYYSYEAPLRHSHDFLNSGSDEPEIAALYEEEQQSGTCDKSLTYVLDGNFGLFFHLTALAQAYSFAQLSNRSFFIADDNWDRGRWADHFQPLPDPGCTRPAPDQMKACPRGTRHWAMDAQTLHYHFGHEYQMAFEDPKSSNIWRHMPKFELSRRAFEQILVPSEGTKDLIRLAREELWQRSVEEGAAGRYLGIHIRRGDRHPRDWFHHNDYEPLEDFAVTAQDWWREAFEEVNEVETKKPFVHLASAAAPLMAQSLESLTTYTLASSRHAALRRLATNVPYVQKEFALLDSATRIRQTTGMMVDFDLLTGGWLFEAQTQAELQGAQHHASKRHGEESLPDEPGTPHAVICTLSSNVCKMAAVAMGWEKAIEHGRWVNLDGRYAWDWRPTEVP